MLSEKEFDMRDAMTGAVETEKENNVNKFKFETISIRDVEIQIEMLRLMNRAISLEEGYDGVNNVTFSDATVYILLDISKNYFKFFLSIHTEACAEGIEAFQLFVKQLKTIEKKLELAYNKAVELIDQSDNKGYYSVLRKEFHKARKDHRTILGDLYRAKGYLLDVF